MPRAKPDGKSVIVHRIELGGKERELAESLVFAYGVGKVGAVADGIGVNRAVGELAEAAKNPIVFGFMLMSAAWLYEIVTGKDTAWPTPDDLVSVKAEMEAARLQREAEGEAGAAAGDFSLGGFIYNLLHPNWTWFEEGPQTGA